MELKNLFSHKSANNQFELITADSNFVAQVLAATERQMHFNYSKEEIAEICNAALLVSLTQDESRYISGKLLLGPPPKNNPQQFSLVFETGLPFETKQLTRLLTASDGMVGVFKDTEGKLKIWGMTSNPQSICLYIKIIKPGTISVHTHLSELFTNVPALVDRGRIYTPTVSEDEFIEIINKIFSSSEHRYNKFKFVIRFLSVVKGMCALKHGGSIIILPENCVDHTIQFKYKVTSDTAMSIKNLLEAMDRSQQSWEDSNNDYNKYIHLSQAQNIAKYAINQLAHLTAVDGALVIDKSFKLYGFGGKLPFQPADLSKNVNLEIINLIDDLKSRSISLSEFNGTRHQSAAYYVSLHTEAKAFVYSQDGQLTMLSWDQEKNQVVAYEHFEFFGDFI